MVRLHPFRALRPVEHYVSQVASVPYDVVDRAEAAALAKNNPLSFLHVSRSEIDLPETTDPYAGEVYAKAAANFQALQQQGVLIRESLSCLYLYRLRSGAHIQRGIVACCHVDDYSQDIIKKHETTRKDKEDDRTRHISALNAHVGPVFMTYRDSSAVDELVQRMEKKKPLYDFTAPDNVIHTVWRTQDTGSLIEAFRQVPICYIADGHHRAASAARVALERQKANPRHDGTEEYNWFPVALFPASQLQILPYNRCVRDLNGNTDIDFLAAVRRRFELISPANPAPRRAGHISMYLHGQWYGLNWPPEESADPVSALDVSVLQARLLEPILGITEPRTDKRIDFVGGIRGTDELEKRVNSGKAAVAFSLFPVTVEQLMAIADAGQIMPPKSTWFEPKLRSGLLIHPF